LVAQAASADAARAPSLATLHPSIPPPEVGRGTFPAAVSPCWRSRRLASGRLKMDEAKSVAHIQSVTQASQEVCRLVWQECNKNVDDAILRIINSARLASEAPTSALLSG